MSGNRDDSDRHLEKYFRSIYSDPAAPASFSGQEKLWTQIKRDPKRPPEVTKHKLKQWLMKQETYQIHTSPPKNYPTESIVVESIGEMVDADILHLPLDKPKFNQNYKFLLACIDLFSRKVYFKLLRHKSATTTTGAFQELLDEGMPCKTLRTDAGGEFTGKKFQEMLREKGIAHITAYGHVKANYIERWNRTFQDKLYRWMYENNTLVFVNVIPELVRSYNNTVHSTTGFKPSEVTEKNSMELYEKVYIPILNKRAKTRPKWSFRIGQLVRLSLFKDKFKKGYAQKYSEEVFKVSARIPSHPPRYRIEDLKNEKVSGSFYTQELKAVNAKETSQINWKVERIVNNRKIKGRKYSLIKWFGYPEKFNTLIPTSDLPNYSRKK